MNALHTATETVYDAVPIAPAIAFNPTEADKNLYLLLSNQQMMKTLIPAIKNLRKYHTMPSIKKVIDRSSRTNNESLLALQEFYRVAFCGRIPESMRTSAAFIEKLNLDCAMLAYSTPTSDLEALRQHIDNFHNDSYAVVDSNIVDAFLAADGSFSAGMMELVNRYFPDAEPQYKEAFATGVEKLIQVRENLGVKV